MSTSWIKDKVVAVAEAQAAETGEDAEEIIWQLSKELGKMVQIGEISDEVIGNIDPGFIGVAEITPDQLIDAKTHEILINALVDKQPEPEFDDISKPAHYAEGRKHEPKDVIRDWGLNFNLGSATKYISRCGRKDDAIQELRKAITFIQFEIDARLEEEGDGTQE